jgi:hypothetical protein
MMDAGEVLFRLVGLAQTTRQGLVDLGMPRRMRELETMGYADKIGAGYKITPKGIEHLKVNNHLLKSL